MKLTCIFLFGLLVWIQGFAAIPEISKANIPDWVRQTSKQPKTPNLEDISDGYYFERIEYQVNLADQTRFYRDVKVLTENAGAENAGQVNITFDPQYQALIMHELFVIRDGKRMDRLDLGKFELMASETELSRSIYNGTYAAYMLLADLRKDDKIVISYSLRGFNPVFGNRFADTYFLQGYEPFGLLHVNYVVPKSRKLTFKSFKGADSGNQQDLGSATAYYWDISGTDKVEYETNLPAWYATRQRIECSEFPKWSDVAKWAADVNPIPELSAGGHLKLFCEQLWQNSNGDSIAYVSKVADFVQNDIRYMGVEVGEYSHRANNPEKVFVQRYGDCKDKSVLLAAMLRDKDIEATLILVNSYEEYGVDNYLPSPFAFNHMVVHLVIDGRGQYIDPTITDQGGQFRDRYFPFYGKVLWAKPGGRLQDTEKILSGNMRVEEKFKLQRDGSAQLDVLTVYTGANADNIRAYFKQTAKNNIDKSYVEYYQAFYKQLTKRSALTYKDDKMNNVFRVEEHYDIKSLAGLDPATNRTNVSVYATNLSRYLPSIADGRVVPIALPYPLSLEHDIYIINPDGIAVSPLRENKFTDRESYYYGKSISSINDTLKIAFRLGFHDTHVKAESVSDYHSDFSDKEAFFSSVVFLDDDGLITGSKTANEINIWAVCSFVSMLALYTVFVWKWYHRRRPSTLVRVYEEGRYDRIGGWLIFLLIALLMTALRVFYQGMVQLFFTQQMWNTLDYNFGVHPMLYGLVFILMFVGNTTIFFLSLYCAYLLVKRRDIFPQTLFFLLIFQLTLVLFDEFFSRSIFKEEVTNLEGFSELIRGISFAVIWSLYLFNSTRVKGTFVIPSKTTLMEIATTPALSSLPTIPVSEMPNNEHTRPSHPNQE
ncbi:DUF3857 domain-containing protein [Sphingobacterium shayense]|uniref:DUF3857 domain-containing protein n=1 Tax=Sphingobacterium shayense TaxID=626343 RepID=UPI0015577B41|nr:DUF3857 domain-containing protein [Sphingobacterium shayense]NQD69827.1 DUF3857 domain-containing protein [Sphingobacterium shayense]